MLSQAKPGLPRGCALSWSFLKVYNKRSLRQFTTVLSLTLVRTNNYTKGQEMAKKWSVEVETRLVEVEKARYR